MSATTKSFALASGGLALAVLSDGRLVEQVPSTGNIVGRFDTEWRDVTTVGLTGKIGQIACRYDGAIVALTNHGLFALDRSHNGYGKSWRPIDPPAEAP